jgi:hypothetical protein
MNIGSKGFQEVPKVPEGSGFGAWHLLEAGTF